MASLGQRQAIEELVREAAAKGSSDEYRGKRRWRRYLIGKPLEVTTDPERPGAAFRVTTHNISGGGLGFWSKIAFTIGESLWVREWTEEHTTTWLDCVVSYSVVGTHGYLVGVSFAHTTEPDSEFDMGRYRTESPAETSGSGKPLFTRVSLAAFCSLSCAAGGFFSAASVVWAPRAAAWWGGGDVLSLLLVFAAIATGPVLAWLVARHEARILGRIQQAIEQLEAGEPGNGALPQAWTREPARLREKVLNLSVWWKDCVEHERRRREQAESLNRLKTNVLTMVSHDLRTPLTSIQMYSHILEQDFEQLEPETSRQFLSVISDECMQLSRLMEDVLQVQRLEEGSLQWAMQSMNIGTLVTAAEKRFMPIAMSRQVQFQISCPEKLPGLVADPDRLSQVLNNLLSNAFKFTPADGVVSLGVEVHEQEIHVLVTDTGPGIARHDWDRIFERFTQLAPAVGADNRGAGLGLFIVRQIVEAHGGRIWLDSELGVGTTFVVALPLCGGTEPVPETPEDAEGLPTILVCDADPGLAATLSQLVRRQGWRVLAAHSANRLLEHMRQDGIDVVLADLDLPDMPALDLLERFEERQKSKVAIIHSMGGDYGELRRHGMQMFLRRPCTSDELVHAVKLGLHLRAGGGPAVLLLGGCAFDTERAAELFSQSDCFPIVARDERAAAQVLGSYPIEVVVAKANLIGELAGWHKSVVESCGWNASVCILYDPAQLPEGPPPGLPGTAIAYASGAESAGIRAVLGQFEHAERVGR